MRGHIEWSVRDYWPGRVVAEKVAILPIRSGRTGLGTNPPPQFGQTFLKKVINTGRAEGAFE